MQTLRAENLTSVYGEKTLFDQLNFLINENDRIGLIGTNGSGKTSLLNVISGEVHADNGEIIVPNDYTIGFLHQLPVLDDQLSVLDAVFAGGQEIFKVIRNYEDTLAQLEQNPADEETMARFTKAQNLMDQKDAWNAESEVKTILTQLKITNLAQLVGDLSGGQKKRVGLAQVLIQAPDLLLLDEPTNHLDIDSTVWLQDYLSNYSGAVIVVTHDRYFLDQVANNIWELSFGKLYEYSGNYQEYVQKKAERVSLEAETEHKQQQLYKKELAWMKTGAKARSTKQKGRINHFHELEQNVGNLQVDEDVDINLGQQRLGKDVIKIEDAKLKFGQRVILDDFSTLIQAGDRVGITGENGVGKSSLLNVIAQKQQLDSGLVKIGETVHLGYYTQQTEPIDEDKRMINYLSETAQNITDKNGNVVSVTQLLEQFLFPRFMHGTLIRKLSGGEKRRLFLLKILMMQPNVLLLDEPTNDLDIATLTVLEDYLDSFNGTVITVSHDRYFLDKVADQLLVFEGQGKIKPFEGRYSDYLSQRQELISSTNKKPETSKKQTPKKDQTADGKRKLTYAEQMEWDQIESQIDELEQQKQSIAAQMNDNASDYDKLAKLQEDLDNVNQAIDDKTDRWEYLSEFAE